MCCWILFASILWRIFASIFTLLNNQEITEEITEEIKKYLETNDNENTTPQNTPPDVDVPTRKTRSSLIHHNTVRLDINYRKKSVKITNTWRLNNILLNNQEITEEIKKEIRKYLKTNDNENTMTQNLWHAAKAVLRGKFIAI